MNTCMPRLLKAHNKFVWMTIPKKMCRGGSCMKNMLVVGSAAALAKTDWKQGWEARLNDKPIDMARAADALPQKCKPID